MSAEVPFVRVVPEEIERYGFAGAAFVAHIRYRCGRDGPGRIMADGVRWWQVSLADLAAELHVSRDVAKRTMKQLVDAGAVAANRFGPLSDRTLAYHVPPQRDSLTCQRAESHRPDLPYGDSAPPLGGIAPTLVRNRTDLGAESPCVPLLGESEEGGEGGGGHPPPTAATPPANSEPASSEPNPLRNGHPPKRFLEENNQPATPEPGPFDYPDDDPDGAPADDADAPPTPDELARAADLPPHPDDQPALTEPEPSPFCPKHPSGTSKSCQDCGDARKRNAAWHQQRREFNAALRAARDAWIAACRECEDNDADGRCGGWVLDPWDELPAAVRCRHPRLLRAYAARHGAFTIPARRAAS